MLRLQARITTSALGCAEDQTQGFIHGRQAFCPLSYIPTLIQYFYQLQSFHKALIQKKVSNWNCSSSGSIILLLSKQSQQKEEEVEENKRRQQEGNRPRGQTLEGLVVSSLSTVPTAQLPNRNNHNTHSWDFKINFSMQSDAMWFFPEQIYNP